MCQHNYDYDVEVSIENLRMLTVYLLNSFVVPSNHTNGMGQHDQ